MEGGGAGSGANSKRRVEFKRRVAYCVAPRDGAGIFMHQPWPSSEIFCCLSHRKDLLRGILCADHIGFHLYEWARNFLSCCRRLLSCTFEVGHSTWEEGRGGEGEGRRWGRGGEAVGKRGKVLGGG